MTDGQRIRYVLDTDTTSAIQRKQPEVRRRLADTEPGTVATTIVTLFRDFERVPGLRIEDWTIA
jgi:predicted nucleic acid-binding protein